MTKIRRCSFTIALALAAIFSSLPHSSDSLAVRASKIPAVGASQTPKIAVARTAGIEGDPQIFQERIAAQLTSTSAEVIKVGADQETQAIEAARDSEFDFVLLTDFKRNGQGIKIGEAIDKAGSIARVLDKAPLPDWMKKADRPIRDTKRTADIAGGLKNVLNIQPKDRVTLTHRLISLSTSKEVGGQIHNEVAESEEQVVSKLVNNVVNDVLARAKTGAPSGSFGRPRPTTVSRNEEPEEIAKPIKKRTPICTVELTEIPGRGLRLGMTEAEVRALIAPASKLKAGGYSATVDGISEITLTPRETRKPKEFEGYKTVTFRFVENKVAAIVVKYADSAAPADLEEFISSANETFGLPDAWESRETDATIKCQEIDLQVNAAEKTLSLTNTSTLGKKKPRRKL